MLNVHKVRLRFISARLLASVASIFKRLTEGASFQKRWFKNLRRIYFVAAHKLILNVSKIRLRLICACASYLRRLFQKAYGKGASALSLHKKQSSTYSKYACGCFLCAPSICIVYFKRLTEGVHLRRRYVEIDAQRSRAATDGGGVNQ